jgi:uncharacterized protein (TIGR02611 family)
MRSRSTELWPEAVRQARRVICLIVGTTLVFFGIVMLITPGPGWLLIFAGFSVLALEFAWSRRLLRRVKAKSSDLRRTLLDSHKE